MTKQKRMGDRRTGIDRRHFSYTFYVPERRFGERRQFVRRKEDRIT